MSYSQSNQLNELQHGRLADAGHPLLRLRGLTLVFGVLVVANPFSRNPVTSAMFLVLTIVSLAGLFVLLHAFFLAAVQILVYAGAVMVLFLFVIMLLDLKEEERRKIKVFGIVGGLVSVGAILAISLKALQARRIRARICPRRSSKAEPPRSASCCSRNTCCRLKSSPCCCSWRWWA